MRVCMSEGLCGICQVNPQFRAQHGVEECPRWYELRTPDSQKEKSPKAVAGNALLDQACLHRGIPEGTCFCGALKYRCDLIGITVRTRARPGHPNDIVCDPTTCKAKAQAGSFPDILSGN